MLRVPIFITFVALSACLGEPSLEEQAAPLGDGSGVPSQPGQPRFGPGGSDYLHGGTERTHYQVQTAWGPMSYTVVEPIAPRPASAPVLLYLMGNFVPLPSAVSQELYGAFEEHLARKGWVVIHPSNEFMDEEIRVPGTTVNDVDDILTEVTRVALAGQALPGRVRPAVDARGVQLAVAGHSAGGLFAQLVADQAAQNDLPPARAIILHDATWRSAATGVVDPEDPMSLDGLVLPETLANVPASTYVLDLHPADGVFATFLEDPSELVLRFTHHHADSRKLLATVPDSRYSFLRSRRDAHGAPVVEAGHLCVIGTTSPLLNASFEAIVATYLAPAIPFELASALRVDATDWYALWKPTEAMLELAVRGRSGYRKYVFEGDTDAYVRNMGAWSDGVRVRPLETKADFADWFDLSSTLPPVPDAPGGVYLGGQPEADLGSAPAPGSPRSAVLLLGNFEADPIRIRSVALDGDPALRFPAAGPLTADCDPEMPGHGSLCVLTIELAPTSPGPLEADLLVEYERAGQSATLVRHLRAFGRTPD